MPKVKESFNEALTEPPPKVKRKVGWPTSLRLTTDEHESVAELAQEAEVTHSDVLRFAFNWAKQQEGFRKALCDARRHAGKTVLEMP